MLCGMFEIQLRWSHVHQSRHICSYSGVLKCTLLLSVTFYALQAFKILPSWAGMRKQELPKISFLHAKNLNCNMGRPPQSCSVLLAPTLKLTRVFSSLLQKLSVELLCVPSPVLDQQGGIEFMALAWSCTSAACPEAQSTRAHNKTQSPGAEVLFSVCFQALMIKACVQGTVPG